MGLIETQIKEIRTAMRLRMDGSLKEDDYKDYIAGAKQVNELVKAMVGVTALKAKYGKTSVKELYDCNLMGNRSVIDISTDAKTDSIECPDQEKIITRLECKRYSESTGNLSTCETCQNFALTRRLLSEVAA